MGGEYGGGGGGGGRNASSQALGKGIGRGGAVRIMWPGDERAYPSTRVADES
jgi:hypothetical protein